MLRPCLALALALALTGGCWGSAPTTTTTPKAVARAWEVPAAFPFVPSLYGVHGTSLADLYAVGDRGAVLHSTDRGATWIRVPYRSDLSFHGVWASGSAAFGVASFIGDDGIPGAAVVRFVGGVSTAAFPVNGAGLEDVWGTGSAIFAVGLYHPTDADPSAHGLLLRSRDGGTTWTGIGLGTSALVAIGGTGSAIHALARDGTLWTSTDGGDHYSSTHLPAGDDYEALDVAPGRLLAASDHRRIVRSTDGGTTWTEVRGTSDGQVWSIGDHVFAFHNGELAQSHDGGTTWTERVTREIVRAVWGTRDGFVAVGQGGLVMTSTDGTTWERRDRGVVGALNDVWGSGDDVWAVGTDGGRGGVIVHAIANGKEVAFARGGWADLNGVWGTGPDAVFAVGDRGTILRSRDRGASWQPVASGTAETLRAIGGCDASAIYAVGDAGTILSSRDRGTTWQPLAHGEPVDRLTDVACIAGVAYAAGPVDVLRLDGGRVTRFGTPPTETQRAREASRTTGIVWGRDRELWWLTEDELRHAAAGSSWQRVRSPGPHYSAWDTGETLLVGSWGGTVYAIDHAGRAKEQLTDADRALRAMWGTPGGDVWGVGGDGTILRYAVPAARRAGPLIVRPVPPARVPAGTSAVPAHSS